MRFIKHAFFATIFLLSVADLAAQCTLRTPCGTQSYDVSGIAFSSTVVDGVTTITVTSNGAVIDNLTCDRAGAIRSSCRGGGDRPRRTRGGSSSLCDFVSAPLFRAWLGCD